MPVFPHHKAVFVHVPKVAGQTVERLLDCSYRCEDLYGVDGDIELSHLSIEEIRARYTVPADYFTFAFVRNPWDRLVSEYHYRAEANHFPYLPRTPDGFDGFVYAVAALDVRALPHVIVNHLYTQTDMVRTADGDGIDFLGRYETFESDLRTILDAIGLSAVRIPRVNVSRRGPYQMYYNSTTAALVGRMYARDAEAFNYGFDNG